MFHYLVPSTRETHLKTGSKESWIHRAFIFRRFGLKSKYVIYNRNGDCTFTAIAFAHPSSGCHEHLADLIGNWGDKPWYDWAMIQWDHESDPYPAQICMLLDLSEARFMNDAELDVLRNSPLGARLMNDPAYTHLTGGNNYEYLSRTKWMVVRSSLSTEEQGVRVRDEYRLESTICKRYYMEDQYRIIPVDAIEGPAFCLHVNGTIETSNDVSGSNEIILLTQKNEWKSMFLNKGI